MPLNGCFNGIPRNMPRRSSRAPVHRLGSHCAKSHIRSCSPFSGLSPAGVTGWHIAMDVEGSWSCSLVVSLSCRWRLMPVSLLFLFELPVLLRAMIELVICRCRIMSMCAVCRVCRARSGSGGMCRCTAWLVLVVTLVRGVTLGYPK